jgi:hypothetical protein
MKTLNKNNTIIYYGENYEDAWIAGPNIQSYAIFFPNKFGSYSNYYAVFDCSFMLLYVLFI